MFCVDFSQTVPKLRYFPNVQGTRPQSQRTGKKPGKHATLYSHKACLNLNNNKEILIFNALLNLYFLKFDKNYLYCMQACLSSLAKSWVIGGEHLCWGPAGVM